MRYCTRCRRLFDGPECPDCRSLGRTPRAEDWCLLSEEPRVYCDMLRDVLEQNGIPSVFAATQGGLGLFSNVNMELYRLFVPYPRLEEAARLRAELFSASLPDENADGAPSEGGED